MGPLKVKGINDSLLFVRGWFWLLLEAAITYSGQRSLKLTEARLAPYLCKMLTLLGLMPSK